MFRFLPFLKEDYSNSVGYTLPTIVDLDVLLDIDGRKGELVWWCVVWILVYMNIYVAGTSCPPFSVK